WGGVATALLQRGIPAVVAMQFSIGDRRAAAFAGATYRALVGGLTIDEAVAVGRTATRTTARGEQPDARDWAVPVLYLRAGDARLFEPVTEPAAREAAIAETVSVLQQIGMNKGVVVGILTGEAGGVGVHQEVDDNAGVVIGAIGGPLADSSDALARALAALRDLNPPKDG
ncbi:MAG TPA: CHAT domain-containing protein, partial [Acidimicrobiales bacterium]|nr:CHAT domain-containing protein [Acidimicrobiales bacterium]